MEVLIISKLEIPLTYFHQMDELDIQLSEPLGAGEVFEISITYQGIPQSGLNSSQHQNHPIIWSLGTAYAAVCHRR